MVERDEAGRFLPGNRIWELATEVSGRKRVFDRAEDLWAAAVEYFRWVEDNPLFEAKAFSYEGVVTVTQLPKMRAMTQGGLLLSMGISKETWRGWKTEGHEMYRQDLAEVIATVEAVIYEQKFTGAAAELLNPSIIARDLGLADKKQLGNDPDNPLPEAQVTFFALPDNGRG